MDCGFFEFQGMRRREKKMNNKIKNAVLVGTMLAGLAVTLPVQAKSVALSELNTFTAENMQAYTEGKLEQSHWAYKTLQNIKSNYGLSLEDEMESKQALTRKEAAIMLVNLVGQIEEKKLKLTPAEKARVEILEEEFGPEIARMEADIAVLKGRVSNLEENQKKLWGFNHGEDLKITGAMQAVYYGNFQPGAPSTASNFSLPYADIKVTGKMSEHLGFTAVAVPTRGFTSAAGGLLDELFLSTDIVPHHDVQVGQVWLPFGMEAPLYPTDINFIEYSQLSLNLGQGLDTGVNVLGDWGWINYTAGVFNGAGQNLTDNNHGMGYAAQVNLMPFHNNPDWGELVIGGSHLKNRNTTNNVDGIGGHIKYDIGKFGLAFEYLDLDGLGGTSMLEGQGFYFDLLYRATDKLTLLARYDQYNPDITIGSDRSIEYTAGANYAIAENVLLMLNYTYGQRQGATNNDSNRLGALAQVLF